MTFAESQELRVEYWMLQAEKAFFSPTLPFSAKRNLVGHYRQLANSYRVFLPELIIPHDS